MWRSNTSSALTLVITLALIRHFSKPPQESSQADNGRGGQSRSGSKPKVDMVSLLRLLDDALTLQPVQPVYIGTVLLIDTLHCKTTSTR